jgi:excisionase family DNA binding protein
MSVEEVAELFEVTPATVREWLRAGKLPGVRPGRDWKIQREDVYNLAQLEYGDK